MPLSRVSGGSCSCWEGRCWCWVTARSGKQILAAFPPCAHVNGAWTARAASRGRHMLWQPQSSQRGVHGQKIYRRVNKFSSPPCKGLSPRQVGQINTGADCQGVRERNKSGCREGCRCLTPALPRPCPNAGCRGLPDLKQGWGCARTQQHLLSPADLSSPPPQPHSSIISPQAISQGVHLRLPAPSLNNLSQG